MAMGLLIAISSGLFELTIAALDLWQLWTDPGWFTGLTAILAPVQASIPMGAGTAIFFIGWRSHRRHRGGLAPTARFFLGLLCTMGVLLAIGSGFALLDLIIDAVASERRTCCRDIIAVLKGLGIMAAVTIVPMAIGTAIFVASWRAYRAQGLPHGR